jgi:hypothetical protein
MTQTRLLSNAADHLEEFQAVMATAAGRPSHFEGKDFSHTTVEVMPDRMQGIDRREAIGRLRAGPVAGNENSPAGGTDSVRIPE